MAALADPTRLQMLALMLRHGELCVCDFVGALEITQSKASRHLRILWRAGLLEDRRAGLWVHYRVTSERDGEREVLLAAMERVFQLHDLSDLDRRVERWRARKTRAAGSLQRSPRRAVRPRAEAVR